MKPLPRTPVVSTITCTYDRPRFLRIAVESLRRQTYPHLQIIVIKNGCAADSETSTYLERVASEDPRMVVIDYPERQFSFDDPQKMLDCMNDAMRTVAAGDLVFTMDDDDFIGDDYLEKMVRLFEEHPACTTAAGLPLSIDATETVPERARERALARNNRPRYTQGHLVAADLALSDQPTMWGASTYVFVIRRDEYLAAGGILRGEHYASLYGVVAFGITGFDSTAILYNREHPDQLNKAHVAFGNDAAHHVVDALKTMRVGERWAERFGEESARRVVSAIIDKTHAGMAHHADSLYWRGSLAAAARQYERCLLVRPDDAQSYRRLGDICLRKSHIRQARRHYARSVELAAGTREGTAPSRPSSARFRAMVRELKTMRMVGVRLVVTRMSSIQVVRSAVLRASAMTTQLTRAVRGLTPRVG